MKKHLNIGIAGCGIGGLTAGALLAQAGHNVTIFDQFANPAPVGSGLVVQPVGQEVLRAVGALDAVLEAGRKIQEMNGHEVKHGRRVLNVSYGKDFGIGIHRSSLFATLYDAAIKAGCKITPNSVVTSTQLAGDGRCITMADGAIKGPFDLVIDAAGASSVLSTLAPKPLRFGAIWSTVNWPAETDLQLDQLSQCYSSASIMAGVLPIGLIENHPKPKAAIFWSLRQNEYDAWRKTPIEDWKAEAITLWPAFAPFLNQITNHDDFTMARYGHGTLSDNIDIQLVHIGDAAHCASPQLGQGANMAMLDAYVLAQMIAEHPLKEALPAYAKSRRNHVRLYQLMSWALTPMYQSDSKIMPWLRDWILAPLSYLRPFRWMLSKIGSGNFIAPIKGRRIPPPHSSAKSD